MEEALTIVLSELQPACLEDNASPAVSGEPVNEADKEQLSSSSAELELAQVAQDGCQVCCFYTSVAFT